MTDDDRWLRIDRYLAGELSPSEVAALRQELSAMGQDMTMLEQWRAARERDSSATRAAIHQQIADEHHVIDPVAESELRAAMSSTPSLATMLTPARRPYFQSTWMPWAVAAALCIGVGLTAWQICGPRTKDVSFAHEYATANGERLHVALDDGTEVTLAPASRLRLGPTFGTGARAVALQGEAYFAVVHDAAHPFSVATAQGVVHDVGTAFDVRTYSEDADVRVAVAEGVVGLSCDACSTATPGPVRVTQGSLARMSASGISVQQNIDISLAMAWMQNRLVFNDAPLAEIAATLSRTFDVAVTVADSTLAHQHFTATYASESLDEVLDDITHAMGAQYDRAGQTITIRRRSGPANRRDTPTPQPLTTVQANHA